jgi:hypothetical protein
MRGNDEQQLDVFSYVSSEQRVPHDLSFVKIPSGSKPVAINSIPKAASEASAECKQCYIHLKTRRTKFLRTTGVGKRPEVT